MSVSSDSNGVLIIGGGFAGLAADARLAQIGIPVTVYEAASLGSAASTQNQGWLYSGAWFAREDPALAGACYNALRATEAFCPDCIGRNGNGAISDKMVYFSSRPETDIDEWTSAWSRAGIPFEELTSAEASAALPDVTPSAIQRAFRLPDRVFAPTVLLKRLAQVAEERGAHVRTQTPVRSLLITDDTVEGLKLGNGEEIHSRLVIDATGAFSKAHWSERLERVPKTLAGGRHVSLLKTHLISCAAGLHSAPFCIIDADGFNVIPHNGLTVFGSASWREASSAVANRVDADQIAHLWFLAESFLPNIDHLTAPVVKEWAGVTAQVPDVVGTCETTPRAAAIDHSMSTPPLHRLLSIYPGRATLWNHLADQVKVYVSEYLDLRTLATATPPRKV